MIINFECPCGYVAYDVIVTYAESKKPRVCPHCKKKTLERQFGRLRDPTAEPDRTQNCRTGEIVSEFGGCGVGQEKLFSQDCAEAHIDAHYREDGCLVAPNRHEKNLALALRGMHNKHDDCYQRRLKHRQAAGRRR